MSSTRAALLDMDARKRRASTWFAELRDRLQRAFEALEDAAPADLYPGSPGRFVLTPWDRAEGGGGVMGMMHGRLFEKVGVHVSTVHGELSPDFAKSMPGTETDRRFFATGVSLIAHMRSPRVPAVHMNTRFIATTQSWFGGGGDLTPLLADQRSQEAPDAKAFHAALQAACDAHDPTWHAKYKAWCDEYFFLPTGTSPAASAASSTTGTTAASSSATSPSPRMWARLAGRLSTIVRAPHGRALDAEEREEQLVRRGRYVEFNLLYDRGTLFGLKTGGNMDSILSSMPPEVKWP